MTFIDFDAVIDAISVSLPREQWYVLYSQGAYGYNNEGNKVYKEITGAFRKTYNTAPNNKKRGIILSVVRALKDRNWGFYIKNGEDFVPISEEKAVGKKVL
eukprot:jgi/Psemu1/301324/fgenesh1_kg.30_\